MQEKSLFSTEQLLQPLEADLRRAEPVLWIQRLVILTEASPHAVVRDIPFQQGLNIIRTKKREVDEEEVVAHSVGKTLLMRLIRYSLGESAFASHADTKRIQKKMPEGMVCAEWRVADQLWTVIRPLGEAQADCSFAVSGEGWQNALKADSKRQPLSMLIKLIEDAAFGELPKLESLKGGRLGWLDVLPWMARDSDCGFRKPHYWRDKDLHPPGLRDLSSNKLIMQWVMGLMSAAETAARNQSAETREQKKELKKEVDRFEHNLQQSYTSLSARCNFVPPSFEENAKSPSLLDLADLLRGFINSETREAEENLSRLVSENSATINSLRLRERQQSDQKTGAAVDGGNARTRRDILRRQLLDETRKAKKPTQCPAKDSCEWLIQIQQEEEAADWDEKPQMLRDLQEEIQKAEQEASDAEDREKRLSDQIEETGKELVSFERQFNKDRSALERSLGRWQELSEEVGRLADAADTFSDEVHKQEEAENEIKQSGELIKQKQSDVEFQTSIFRLTNCYRHVLTRLFNPDAAGEVKVDQNGLLPHPSIDLTPNGTAMAVMARVLAFEMACLLNSICGHGYHPRLLMHDSPREGEMEPPLFQRLFDVLEWMERNFGGPTCPFQYIITTTDPPPEFTEEHEKVVLTLHGRSAEGRLLKRKF